MKPTNKLNKKPNKICRECGCEIIEQVESPLFECERCIGKHAE